MKKLLLIFSVLFLTNVVKSQIVFCPPGAQWRYLFYNTYSYEYTHEDMKYTGDSIVNGESVKVIRYGTFFKIPIEDYCNKAFIKQKGDTVFIKNCMTGGTWQILYNFAATAGQSWSATVKDSSLYGYGSHHSTTYQVVVDAVTTVTLNNTPLKKLFVSYCFPSPYSNMVICYNSEILERVGDTTYLFNYMIFSSKVDPPKLSDFLCYSDNGFGTANFSDKQCDYNVGIREIKTTDKISMFPQPAGNFVTVEFGSAATAGTYEATIVDVTGKTVLSPPVQLLNSGASLDVSALPVGLYYVRLLDKGVMVSSGKLLKD